MSTTAHRTRSRANEHRRGTVSDKPVTWKSRSCWPSSALVAFVFFGFLGPDKTAKIRHLLRR